jgi:hypothetical protein
LADRDVPWTEKIGVWKVLLGAGNAIKMAEASRDAIGDEAKVAVSSHPAASPVAASEPGRRSGEEIAAARCYRAQAKSANILRAYASDWRQFEPPSARPEAVSIYLAAFALVGMADNTSMKLSTESES